MNMADEVRERSARQLRVHVNALRAAAARALDPELRQRLHDKALRLEEQSEQRPGAGRASSV
ncbi:DUF6381 family protein [Streptomyces sp. NPDC056670]|uniref:DUF6381 family protein n=1 Tax=unclassified Streptomyces TaxID=2593676 RepID=UPI0036B77FCA